MSFYPRDPAADTWQPPAGSRPSPETASEGRIARSWRLINASWRFLRQRPGMVVLPALGAVCTSVATAAIFLPVLYATQDLHGKLPVLIASAASALPVTILGTYFNVAFLLAVDGHLRKRPLSATAALRAALGRWRAIVAWSLLSTIVGLVMQVLEQLPGGA